MADRDEEFIIRPGTGEDVELALTFRRLLFKEMGVADSLLLDDVREVLADLYKKEYQADRIRHFIAYGPENKPAAIAGALLKEDFPYYLFKPGYYGWIIDVYTVPEYRGKGLSARLMERTIQWLKGKGVQEAKLIASGKDARRLYERTGFKPTWEMSYNLSETKTYNEILDER